MPRIRSPLPDGTEDAPGRSSVADIDRLFREYAPMVASLGLAMLGKRDEAEDLVQDVFMRAWRAIGQLEHPESVRSWLMTITVRVAHTRLARRRLSRLFLPAGDVNIEDIAAPETIPEEKLALQRLFTILEKMPVDLRIAWVLRYIQDETVESVASLCGCSVSTAKRRIRAAQARVSKRMPT